MAVPPNAFQRFDAELRVASATFGVMLRRWRRANDWSQQIPVDWGREADFLHLHGSTWSQLETNTLRNPGPKVWAGLGEINGRLQARNYGTLRSAELRRRLESAQPICHADGRPWTAGDFLMAYMGQLSWPPLQEVNPAPKLSEAAAARLSHQIRDSFQAIAQDADLEPVEAILQVLEHVDGSPAERQLFQRVLLGFHVYSPQELSLLWADGKYRPQQWLEGLQRKQPSA